MSDRIAPKGRRGLPERLRNFGRHLVYSEGTRTEPLFVEDIKSCIAGKYKVRPDDIEIVQCGKGRSFNTVSLAKFAVKDAYFRFSFDFIRGNLTLAQLQYAYNLGDLGVQYAITSEKGIHHLKHHKSIPSKAEYVGRYFEGVKMASRRFDELDKEEDGIRIQDIMRKKR